MREPRRTDVLFLCVANSARSQLAEGLGRRIMANIVMLGFVCGATGILERDALRDAVEASVPKDTEEANLLAFDTGYEYANGGGP